MPDERRGRWPGLDSGGSGRAGGDNRGARWRFSLWWLLALVIVLYLLRGFAHVGPQTIDYSRFLDLVNSNQIVGTVTVSATMVAGTYEVGGAKHDFQATNENAPAIACDHHG